MNNTNDLYNRWLAQPDLDDAVKAELVSIAGDSDAVTDRFYRDLEFGTGGLRGVIGAGTNRMNLYTVRKATQGLAARPPACWPRTALPPACTPGLSRPRRFRGRCGTSAAARASA